MLNVLAQLAIVYGIKQLQSWLADDPATPKDKIKTPEPNVREGDTLPIIYGRTRVSSPGLVWSSDVIQNDRFWAEGSELNDDSFLPGPGVPPGQLEYGANMFFVLGMTGGDGSQRAYDRLFAVWCGDQKIDMNLRSQELIKISPAQTFGPLGPPAGWGFLGPCRGIIQFFAGDETQRISNNDPPYVFPLDPFDDLTEIAGFMRVEGDRHTQSAVQITQVPSFRRMMTVALTGDHLCRLDADTNFTNTHFYLSGFFFGQSGSLPPISFEVWNSWHLWSNPLSNGDASPVDVIYDILTNSFGRLGLPTTIIDATSFSVAAGTLSNEEHGFSHCFDSASTGTDALAMIVQQIGAALYYDVVDRKIHLKLIRDDYNSLTIPSFNESHILVDPEPEYTLGSWTNVVDAVEVRYKERFLDYADASIIKSNQALAVVQSESATDGRIRQVAIDYPGVSNRKLAAKLAARDLSYLTQPLATLKVTLNRTLDATGVYNAAQLRPGDVFKLNLADYHIVDGVFRVDKVDLGQLGANAITIEATQDPFWNAAAADVDPPTGTLYLAQATPVNHRHISEAPRWLVQKLVDQGLLNATNVQREWGLAAPDDAATTFSVGNLSGLTLVDDQPDNYFMRRFVLEVDVTRESEPYDTVGLIEGSFFGPDAASYVATIAVRVASLIATYSGDVVATGQMLLLLGEEVIGFETFVDTTAGGCTFGKLWRGMLDTVPVAHTSGEDGWLIGLGWQSTGYVGRGGWANVAGVQFRTTGRLAIGLGSGADVVDTVNFQGRTNLQYPAANFGVAGGDMVGVQGTPAQTILSSALTGYYKRVDVLEGDITNIAYKARDKYSSTIRRGDEAAEDVTDPNVTYSLYAAKGSGAEVALKSSIADDGNGGVYVQALLGAVGHGDIDAILHTSISKAAGGHGVPPASFTLSGWQSPRVTLTAPRWRNLLADPHLFFFATAGGVDKWVVDSGSPQVYTSSSSLGDSLRPYIAGLAATGNCAFSQTIDVSGYLARGMKAACWFYYRNINADLDDTIAVDFYALDSGGGILATQSLAATVGSSSFWKRVALTHAALPAGTVKLKLKVTLACVTGGDTRADAAFSEPAIYVGDFLDDVLANPTFNGGGASWTTASGGFIFPSTIPFDTRAGSATYAQGGAFAASELRQDYAVPTGREFGTFVLRCWRLNDGNNDTGEVIVEALSGASAVLASTTTGVEAMTTQGKWYPRRLVLDLPDGTVTVRVRLKANRAAGAGNSGACFCEEHAQLHSDLDSNYTRTLLLSSPTVQKVPTSWQQWHTSYVAQIDGGIIAPTVIGPHLASSWNGATSAPLRLRWSDDLGRVDDVFVGQWGDGVGSIPGTRFARQSGSGALDLQSFAEVDGFLACNPSLTDAFTVVVYFRVDEPGFATACGLVGRCNGTVGWELSIDATGHVVATLRGVSGTKTIARTGSTVIDGAVHMAALVYDPVAARLYVYDERGSNFVSTATGLGEFSCPITAPLRIGRSRSTIDTIPGMLSPVYYFTQAQFAAYLAGNEYSLWRIGADPTGRLTSMTRSAPVYVVGAPNADGVTLPILASDQYAFGYDSGLAAFADADVGESMGLALTKASTNIVPSWDFGNATYWALDASATMNLARLDPTGKLIGVQVIGNATNGLKALALPMTSNVTLTVVFFARASTGTPTLNVELQNASNVVKGTIGVGLTTKWQRLSVLFSTWDNSTPTARLRFVSASGALTFELSAVVFAQQAVEVPTMFATAAATSLAAVTVSSSETLPLQLNAEGELVAEGIGTQTLSFADATLVSVDNATTNKNAREIGISSTEQGYLNHYDATTPTNVASTGAGNFDVAQKFQIRGRWSSTKMLDATANAYAGVVQAASVSGSAYGRTATFSYDATPDARIRLGAGPSGNAPQNCLLRKVVVRAREEKLP